MEIFDADKLVGEPRILKLGGKEFNVTVIPARTSVLAFVNRDVLDRFNSGNCTIEDYDTFLSILISALKPSYPEITMEWLDGKLTAQNFNDIMLYIMKPAMAEVKSAPGDDKKKESGIETSNSV